MERIRDEYLRQCPLNGLHKPASAGGIKKEEERKGVGP